MSYESVIFDLDGTLSDPSEGIFRSLYHAFDAIGRPDLKQTNLDWFIGPPIFAALSRVLGDPDPSEVEVALNHFRTRYGTVGKFENRLYEGIPELLGVIREHGLRAFVATSKPHAFAHDILEHFGLADRFDDIQGHDISAPHETKTDVMARLLGRNPIDRTKALMIGDRHHDADASHDFGIPCIGVLWGFGKPAEFDHPNVLATIARPADLIEILDRQS
ncbi:HAD hydrolase-like protein [bacterium]|nr:HAD hydrolase-like protein [bacterium]